MSIASFFWYWCPDAYDRVSMRDHALLGAEPASYTTETPPGLQSRLQPGSVA